MPPNNWRPASSGRLSFACAAGRLGEESAVLTAYYLAQQVEYAKDPMSAAKLIGPAAEGDAKDTVTDPAAAAALIVWPERS